MKTLFLNENKNEDIDKAAEVLKNGGVVAIPTETVYGLAADALNPSAVEKIFFAKGRPSDNPLIVHVADFSEVSPLVTEIPNAAEKLAKAFWPGPLTIIMNKSELVPSIISGGLDTVAIRFPANLTTQKLIKAAGVPLAAPSANISGKPSPTKYEHVKGYLDGRADAIIDGGDCAVGLESTVITLVDGIPRVLRPGAITLEQLKSVLGEVEVDTAVLNETEIKKVLSPGMKYKHYAPLASVTIVDASPKEYIDFVNEQDAVALCFDEDIKQLKIPYVSYGGRYCADEQAQRLFSALHSLDDMEAQKAFAHIPQKNGIGLAVYNRLLRAAGFKIINPNNHYIVGLTGPTGSGKSTVAKHLNEFGFFTIDCDAVSKSPETYDSECLSDLQNAFGRDIILNGELNRKLLAERAFSSDEGKKKLNAITHPKISIRIQEIIKQAFADGEKVIVIDGPTIFEAGMDFYCSKIIAVIAPKKLRIERITKRDSISVEAAESRINAQHDDEFFLKRADYSIIDNGEIDLVKTLLPIVRELKIT